MKTNRIALLGSAMMGAALLCAVGVAKAQDYDSRYNRTTYSDERAAPDTETVIVRPYYGVEKRQLVGRINGEVNPTEYSMSQPVDFSDLDLSSARDTIELRERIRSAARELCFQLDERVPQLRGDTSADRECVRTATRNAMRDVLG